MYELILTSTSPNRMDILSGLAIQFKVESPVCDESKIYGVDAVQLTQKRAHAKVESVLSKYKDDKAILIGCDTAIEVCGRVFGKPKNDQDVRSMFRIYSGQFHNVVSSIHCANANTGVCETATSMSRVFFKPLEEEEIDEYIKTGDWRGVAGGYKIQGLASFFIEKIEGSYSGIVGFPLYEFYSILKRLLPIEAYHFLF